MIILSQDKETLVNFNNVQAINVHMMNKRQVCAWFNVDNDPKGSVLLGEYETEERAKEILILIRDHLMNIKNLNGSLPAIEAIAYSLMIQGRIFEMPEK